MLKIYTNWPELITDTSNQWKSTVVGPSRHVKDNLFKLGHMENFLRLYASELISNVDHGLFINTPKSLDIGELLCWVDLDHNAWIDQNIDFALYRNSPQYSTRIIRTST